MKELSTKRATVTPFWWAIKTLFMVRHTVRHTVFLACFSPVTNGACTSRPASCPDKACSRSSNPDRKPCARAVSHGQQLQKPRVPGPAYR